MAAMHQKLRSLRPHFLESSWTEKDSDELKEKICKFSGTVDVSDPQRILFLGLTGAGKTSLIASFISVFVGAITHTSKVGTDNENSTTRQYLEHRLRTDDGLLNIILCDTPGISKSTKGGITEKEIELLLEGKYPSQSVKNENDLGESKHLNDMKETLTPCKSNDEQDTNMEPNGVVFVQNVESSSDRDMDNQKRTLQYVYSLVQKKDIPACVVLTHIDKVKPTLVYNLQHALTSKTIRKLKKETAGVTGFQENRIFVALCYTDEQDDLNTMQDVLLLRTLQGILRDVEQRYHDTKGQLLRYTSTFEMRQRASDHERRKNLIYSLNQGSLWMHDPSATSRWSLSEKRHLDTSFESGSVNEDHKLDTSSSLHSIMQHEAIENLSLHSYPEDYSKVVKVKGAKPLFKATLLQLNERDSEEESSFHLQTQHEYNREEGNDIMNDLKDWFSLQTGSMWISKWLPTDLNIPLEQPLPSTVNYQILFLSPEFPALLLSIHSEDDFQSSGKLEIRSKLEENIKSMQNFTNTMSKVISSALLHYCCCDFIILPCVIDEYKFNRKTLQKQIEEQLKESSMYYGGPVCLTYETYTELKAATTAVVWGSHVPRFLMEDDTKKKQILLLDPDWQKVVSLFIEKLNGSETVSFSYDESVAVKIQIAVLETAKRLSFGTGVVIVTTNEKIKRSVGCLKKQVTKDTGLILKLTVCEKYINRKPDPGKAHIFPDNLQVKLIPSGDYNSTHL